VRWHRDEEWRRATAAAAARGVLCCRPASSAPFCGSNSNSTRSITPVDIYNFAPYDLFDSHSARLGEGGAKDTREKQLL